MGSSKAFKGQGSKLLRGDGASPEAFTAIVEIKNIDKSGSKADLADVTNMDSPSGYREYVATLVDAGEVAFSGNWIAGDATQTDLQADFDGQNRHNFRVQLPTKTLAVGETTPGYWQFAAYVAALDWALPVDKEASITGKLKITGPPVWVDAV